MFKWQRNARLRYNLFILFRFRHIRRSLAGLLLFFCRWGDIIATASWFNSRLRFLPGQRPSLQQLLKHSFSKCSEQMWHWLGLGKFALLIRTSHSLRSDLFFKGSGWKPIPLLESLGVQFEQPTTAHSTILELKLFFPMSAVTSCYAPKPSAWLPKWRTFKLSCHGGFCCYNQVKR